MEQPVIFSAREQEYLLRIIESALQVRDARQFFLWTQGQLQALLPHRLMLCLQFDQHQQLVRLEASHASVLDQAALRALCDPRDGLALRLARHCAAHSLFPCMSEAGAPPDAPLAAFQRDLDASGYANLLLHGSGALAGGATVFVLFGLPQQPGPRQACFLALLLPQLHMALLRLGAAAPSHGAQLARALSARETDILGWLREGKNNAAIGAILGLSPFTVKNHLQRIYRVLMVGNRTEAVARCAALRLLPATFPAPAKPR